MHTTKPHSKVKNFSTQGKSLKWGVYNIGTHHSGNENFLQTVLMISLKLQDLNYAVRHCQWKSVFYSNWS